MAYIKCSYSERSLMVSISLLILTDCHVGQCHRQTQEQTMGRPMRGDKSSCKCLGRKNESLVYSWRLGRANVAMGVQGREAGVGDPMSISTKNMANSWYRFFFDRMYYPTLLMA